MDNLNINSKIIYTNAKHFGIDVLALYQQSAHKIVEKILNKYNRQDYAIICGLGGNGGDGFAIAKELMKKGKNLAVYLIGRPNLIEDPTARELWFELKKIKDPKLKLYQDCYAEDIVGGDIIIECLTGTGLEGEKLNKRFLDVIKRISKLKRPIIAIDLPTLSYKPSLTLSLLYPKTKEAEVIDVNLPKELSLFPGPGEFEALFKPKKHSYKVKNGKILYIFNSNDFNELESLIKFSDDYQVQVYVYSPLGIKTNKKTVNVLEEDLDETIAQVDAVFMGKFDKHSLLNRALISEILEYKFRKYIFSESALKFITIEALEKIPEKLFILGKEIAAKFNIEGEKGFKRTAIESQSNLIVPAIRSYIYSSDGDLRMDLTGKLYQKDIQERLLNLTAVLSTKNDMWLSLRAANFMLTDIDQ